MITNDERREIARNLRQNMVSQPCFASCGNDTARAVIRSGGAVFKACSLADLIEPESLGDHESVKCPKCGGRVTVICDTRDWWTCFCDECGSEFSFDPGKYIAYDAVVKDWENDRDADVVVNRNVKSANTCDRAALLEIARDMEKMSEKSDYSEDAICGKALHSFRLSIYAHFIREACGVKEYDE